MSQRKAARPTRPVSARTRAYCASMKPKPVTPQPKIGRRANPSSADLKEMRRAEVDGANATFPARTVSEPFSFLKVEGTRRFTAFGGTQVRPGDCPCPYWS